jgi:nitroimidazol reductase NimA-like FMN-containing flavoprotein (pyridoxamine 5'-phosphate oxidase superfamily)
MIVTNEDRHEFELRHGDRTMPEAEALKLLGGALVGRLGLSRDDQPYIVPVNFAFKDGHIYVHCAEAGMKIDFLRANSKVCFEVDERIGTVADPVICDYDTAYRSVIIFGLARLVMDLQEKTDAMRLIAVKYAFGKDVEAARKLSSTTVDEYRSSQGSLTSVIDIIVERLTGKYYGV